MYLDFSGEIPTGQYGAGSMTIWDTGTYETEKWSDREVMVVLHGERARGRYVLFQTRPAGRGGKEQPAGRGGKEQPAGREGKAQDQWMIHRMDPPEDPTREPMPEGLRPMLATLAGELPRDQSAYGFEVKWDGIRALASVSGGRVRLEARSGRDVSHRYPELRELGRRLGTTQVVLDGEIVALDANGRPSFERLQRRMHVESESAIRRLRQDVPVAYAIFDVLWLEGHSTMDLPYEERRRLLEDLDLNGPNWQTPPYHRGEGSTLLEATRAGGLEGVVAKRLDSNYEPGVRTRHWLKVKNHCSQEFVIGGWLPGEGARTRLGALVIGVYEPGARGVPEESPRLVYSGRVGTGFTDAEITRLTRLLEERERPDSPFTPPPPVKGVRFVEPDLVCEVEFTEWTGAGILRHPSYKGLRDDRDAREVVREGPAAG